MVPLATSLQDHFSDEASGAEELSDEVHQDNGGRVTASVRWTWDSGSTMIRLCKKVSFAALFFPLSLSHYQIPSWKLTWKLKLPPWKGNTILQNTFWGYMTLRIFDPTDSAARNILTELYISLDVLMGCTSPKISAPKLATMRQPAKSFPQTIEVRFHQPEFQIQFMLLFGSGFQDWAPIFDF